jgi:hypothetical protein
LIGKLAALENTPGNFDAARIQLTIALLKEHFRYHTHILYKPSNCDIWSGNSASICTFKENLFHAADASSPSLTRHPES